MSIFLNIPVANGVTTVDVTPGTAGNLEVTLLAPNAPSAGTVTVDGLPYGKSAYVRIGGATSLPLSSLASGGKLFITDFGHYSALRFTLSGVTGGAGYIVGTVGLSAVTGLPDGAAVGLRAINTQSYVESNTKLGTQFYMQVHVPSIAASSSFSFGFTTGALPIIIKDRQMSAFAVSVTLQLFKQPTFSGGTPVVIQNYNDINPVATTVTVAKGVTVTSSGTPWGDLIQLNG